MYAHVVDIYSALPKAFASCAISSSSPGAAFFAKPATSTFFLFTLTQIRRLLVKSEASNPSIATIPPTSA